MTKEAKGAGAASVINTDGLYEKRKTIYMRSVSGVLNHWRWIMVAFTQILFYGACWLDWGGRQAVLFHLAERKFYIFGMVFWPQDAIYLAVLLVISAYLLFLVTAIGGRLFCGYACPQTVYTEIFMWIERQVEGDRPARMKLDAQPMSARKLRIKVTKHAFWLIVAAWTGFTFVGYFTPIRELAASIAALRLSGWEVFWLFFYSGFLYLMAGFMREQMCKYLCPYARFQGVMFDPDTLIITYDTERGEPRGPWRKNVAASERTLGDCVDCGLCVQVCPTGIDIRDGLQYECISCAACIDACDEVMDKVGYPRGLIRYSTERALEQGWGRREILRQVMRPRVLIYSAILAVVSMAFVASLVLRTPFKVDIVRDRATLARIVEGGQIENIYRIQVMNATEQAREFTLSVEGLPGLQLVSDPKVTIDGAQALWVPVRLRLPYDGAKPGSHEIHFRVDSPGVGDVREKSVFMVPR